MSGIVGGTAQNLNVRNNVYDADPGVLAWVAMTQPLIKTDTLAVNADVTDDATRLLGRVGIDGYRSSDTTYQPLRLDKATNTMLIIDYAHHEIHDGSSFTVSDSVACNTTTIKWMIVTPNTTKYAHLMFDLSCTGEATFLVTGDADRVAGTALTTVNRRRVGTPATSTTTVSRTPTGGATDGATTLLSKRSGIVGVGSKNIEGGEARDINEWILKPNTKYIVSITTYADAFATCKLDWYEHTDIA